MDKTEEKTDVSIDYENMKVIFHCESIQTMNLIVAIVINAFKVAQEDKENDQ